MPIICSICGKDHKELPHIGYAAPFQWNEQLANDPQSFLTEDLCAIEGRDFFIHGVIEIPVHDYEHEFGWGVWVSHKKENFEIYRQNFDSPRIGPFFGWLSTEINFFAKSTLNIKTMAHYRDNGLRPQIVLEESLHPLYLQQKKGISLFEAWEIVHHYASKKNL